MARASKNGLHLAKPWGDSSRYDVVVETGGHFVRCRRNPRPTASPMWDTFTASIRAQTTNSTSGETLIPGSLPDS
jgi:hypothetical protein